MKAIFLIFVTATSLLCSSSHTKRNTANKVVANEFAASITSIDFKKSEIRGENHYGFKYIFNIGISTSSNLDILSFSKSNFPTILKDRVDDKDVIDSIIKGLNGSDVDIDKNPIGLRLVTDNKNFDSIEVETYVENNKSLYMEILYYYKKIPNEASFIGNFFILFRFVFSLIVNLFRCEHIV